MVEATEIQIFGMIDDGEGGSRLAQRGECVQFYDILVRGEATDDGEIPEIEEHENLTFQQMEVARAEVEAKYGISAEEVWGF